MEKQKILKIKTGRIIQNRNLAWIWILGRILEGFGDRKNKLAVHHPSDGWFGEPKSFFSVRQEDLEKTFADLC